MNNTLTNSAIATLMSFAGLSAATAQEDPIKRDAEYYILEAQLAE